MSGPDESCGPSARPEPDAAKAGYGPRQVIRAYVATNALFTIAASLIWAVNTLFLLRSGHIPLALTFVINGAFTASQMIFEVPTGVVADTLGRKTSYLLSIGIIIVSTLIYVLSAQLGWGFWGFIVGSVLLGLGYTFQTGAVDAWLVDALDGTGYEGSKDTVFALNAEVMSAILVVGPVVGGALGGVSLLLPYYVRSVALLAAFVAVALMVREVGFTPRTLTVSSFGAETRAIASAGVRFGWQSRTVRPLLWISALQGIFFMYGFYALSPWLLELIGRDYVWLTGAVFSVFSVASIAGNFTVRRGWLGGRDGDRRPTSILAAAGLLSALCVLAAGVFGLFARQLGSGFGPFLVVAALWVGFGYLWGVSMPMASGYINEHIPSSQRATVLSLNALFNDAGGVVGQPAFGYGAQVYGFAATWVVNGFLLLGVAPLYRASGRAAAAERATGGEGQPGGAPGSA